MTPAPTSFRLPAKTKEQLEELAERWDATLTQVLVVIVDRVHREELRPASNLNGRDE